MQNIDEIFYLMETSCSLWNSKIQGRIIIKGINVFDARIAMQITKYIKQLL